MRIGDTSRVTKVCQGSTALGSSQQDSIAPLRRPERKLIEGDALPSSGHDPLSSRFGEGKRADGKLWALQHTNVVGDLSDDDCGLVLLVGHVFGETCEADGWGVDLGHVEAFDDGGAEGRVCTACEEFVEFDEETGVGVGGFDYLGGGFVAGAATSCFQVNSHVGVVL